MNNKTQDNSDNKSLKWSFCPVCGYKLPEIEKLRYCLKCGLDLIYAQEHKEFPPDYKGQFVKEAENYPKFQFGPSFEKIDEEEITNKKDEKIWGLLPTLGITIAAYLLMLLVGVVVMIPFVLMYYGRINSILYSPYFLILTSLAELILIFVPVLYLGKFLKQPTLKNRLSLLGLSGERQNVIKEILIGVGAAFGGILLVGMTSLAIESFIKFTFGIEFISGDGSDLGSIESFLRGADILALILIVLTMIFVVGFSEEILFRGFLQKGLVKNLGVGRGILLNALIFSFIHVFMVFTYITEEVIVFISYFLAIFIPYFAISLMLSLLFQWRNENLIAVIVAHGLYDALTILLVFWYLNFF